jgi:hypothetical protein
MHRAVTAFVLSVGLIAAGAAPAVADSTRAEYIAQVDPICQAFVGPERDAGKTFIKNVKRWARLAESEKVKPFVRQTRRTASSLDRLVQIDVRLTDQIAAVPPPAADAGTIGTWLNYRREADGLLSSAASAFRHFKFRLFLKRAGAADAASTASIRTISGFGFQVCGVSV